MVDQFTEFGTRTGSLDLADWDRAIMLGFGAQFNEPKGIWQLPIAPLYVETPQGPRTIERAQVVYKRPEPTQIEFDLPEIALIRDDIVPDPARLYSITESYRVPAEGSKPISVNGEIGYTHYETKDQERPYSLLYSIECWARYRHVAQMLLQMVLRAYPIFGKLTVVDGLGVSRTYLAVQQGIADLTQVSSLVDRVCGYSVTIRVEAELTLDRTPEVIPAFTGTQTPTPPTGPPATPVDPNLPPGGIYGDGLPSTRVTVIGQEG